MTPRTYHEAFWVVVGTAAPVMLVTVAVTFNQTLIILTRAARPRSPSPDDRRLFRGFARVVAAGVVLAVFSALAVLLAALISLAYERDVLPLWVAALLIVGGFILVLIVPTPLFLLQRIDRHWRAAGYHPMEARKEAARRKIEAAQRKSYAGRHGSVVGHAPVSGATEPVNLNKAP